MKESGKLVRSKGEVSSIGLMGKCMMGSLRIMNAWDLGSCSIQMGRYWMGSGRRGRSMGNALMCGLMGLDTMSFILMGRNKGKGSWRTLIRHWNNLRKAIRA